MGFDEAREGRPSGHQASPPWMTSIIESGDAQRPIEVAPRRSQKFFLE